MKYLLTIYICSVITGDCIQPAMESLNLQSFYKNHYDCVRSGLGDTFEVLFNGTYFTSDIIEKYQLYPKFSCNLISEQDALELPSSWEPV